MLINRVYNPAKNLFNKLLRVGVLHMFLSLVFVQGLALTTQFAVTRLLSVEDFGVVRVVEAFLSIGMIPAGLGMTSVIVKVIAEAKDDETRGRTFFHTLLLTGVFAGFVCLVLQFVVPQFGFSPEVTNYLLLMVWMFVPMNLSRTAINYFQGLKQIQRVAGVNVWFSIAAFVLVVLGAVVGSLSGWAWGRILGQALFAVVILWIVQRGIVVDFNVRELGSLARLGLLVAFAFTVDSIASSADVLYLEQMLSDSRQVGYYGAAGIVITGCLLVASSVNAVAFPYFAEQASNPRALFQTVSSTMLRLFGVMFLITLGLYIFAPLLTLLVGESYAPAVELVRIMCWGLVPASGMLVLGTWLLAIGRPDGSAVVNLIAIVINFGLIHLLVPNMGISGAAIAFVITTTARMILCGLVLTWIYRKTLFQRDQLKLDDPNHAA
jgi:O-antigen/teichoic acid export membrane protein